MPPIAAAPRDLGTPTETKRQARLRAWTAGSLSRLERDAMTGRTRKTVRGKMIRGLGRLRRRILDDGYPERRLVTHPKVIDGLLRDMARSK